LQQQLNAPDAKQIKEAEDKQEMEGGDVQYMGGEIEAIQEDYPLCSIEQRYKMIQKAEETSQEEESKLMKSVLTDEESNKTTQEGDSTE